MFINGTFWAQILNFLIFYWIFKRLFLKSAVNIVQSETDYNKLLKNKIDASSKELRFQKEQQEKILQNCKLIAENNKPDIFDLKIKTLKSENIELEKTEFKIDKKAVIHDLKNLILEKAHDY